jgi:UDPglucose--hexose-1-phosphate uridylyltransferase
MPQLRKDLTSRTWVIIANERGKRPHDFKVATDEKKGESNCPFCPGHEQETPPEVLALGREEQAPDTPGWSVRVVPNKFPALSGEADDPSFQDGPLVQKTGIGAHEVIVESADHNSTFGTHSQEQMERILSAMIARIKELRLDARLQYVQLFKNAGRKAGASLEHTHCQLVATPIIPPTVEEELQCGHFYYEQHKSCVWCEILNKAQEHGRIVEASGHFAVLCPFASRVPYQVLILPTRHDGEFDSLTPEEIKDLSGILKRTVQRLEVAFNYPPYNLQWHISPLQGPGHYDQYFHWHLELLPRLTIAAGFELGSGIYINPTAPELAAQELREVKTDASTGI